MPLGRVPIENKWIFKEKMDGKFRARLVALGNSQGPGIHLLNNYSPVVNNNPFRFLLLLIENRILKPEAWVWNSPS